MRFISTTLKSPLNRERTKTFLRSTSFLKYILDFTNMTRLFVAGTYIFEWTGIMRDPSVLYGDVPRISTFLSSAVVLDERRNVKIGCRGVGEMTVFRRPPLSHMRFCF